MNHKKEQNTVNTRVILSLIRWHQRQWRDKENKRLQNKTKHRVNLHGYVRYARHDHVAVPPCAQVEGASEEGKVAKSAHSITVSGAKSTSTCCRRQSRRATRPATPLRTSKMPSACFVHRPYRPTHGARYCGRYMGRNQSSTG